MVSRLRWFALILFVCSLTFSKDLSRQQYIHQHYQKFEHRIPMRDGVTLFTSVYKPYDSKTVPILFMRTPYSVKPYGVDEYPTWLGPT